jgi:glycosyltransferase involved in cell wall biosynthesis
VGIVHHISSHVGRLLKSLTLSAARCLSAGWPPYSRLIIVRDQAGWVIDEEMHELEDIANRLGIRLADSRWLAASRQQAVYYGSQFFLLSDDWLRSTHHIGVAYFHGKPGTGVREFDELYQRFSLYHERITRIQVSHSEMRDCLLATGIAPEKVHLIPIGINTSYFSVQTPDSKRRARDYYGIPQTAVVVGSFQKDGVGWGEGREPKLIKGPDIFLQSVERLKRQVPELFVVLSGPSRGYVKAGLEKLGIPYRHFLLDCYPEVGQLFQTLDLYMVTSRLEGGPKAILESMASGVPLVTTRVGQAIDLVCHGENGFMVDVEDVEGLSAWAEWILSHPSSLNIIQRNGRQTAEANSYESQVPMWDRFFNGFIEYRVKTS